MQNFSDFPVLKNPACLLPTKSPSHFKCEDLFFLVSFDFWLMTLHLFHIFKSLSIFSPVWTWWFWRNFLLVKFIGTSQIPRILPLTAFFLLILLNVIVSHYFMYFILFSLCQFSHFLFVISLGSRTIFVYTVSLSAVSKPYSVIVLAAVRSFNNMFKN